ncbi:MAG: imidazoleglycerol-phosphate dehydratase HisB [Clostridia bacterium]|nr:imidazoleglycerol-phosphate dehydratase HisB [Clostridia bacterium]
MRIATVERKTKETDILLKLDLDSQGADIVTGIGFFDHMLCAFATHAGINLYIRAKGDIEVDGHHTVEDIGIALGRAFKEALGNKAGIVRFADCFLPMDEALAFAALDISGRSFLDYESRFIESFCGDYETALTEEFLRALAFNAEITLHVKCMYGSNAHHKTEAIYKAVARCLRNAIKIEGSAVPSSKGTL